METLKPNAETFRLRAFTNLLSKDTDKALLEIKKALELEPQWETIRFTAATINYYSALSNAVLPEHILSWPQPVDWAFVRRDNESLVRLREAAKIFQELAKLPSKEKDERQIFESWCLACLLNDLERQEDATKYCKKLLETDRTHFRALVWAIARDLNVDLKSSEIVLRTHVVQGKSDIPHIVTLISYYLAFRKTKKAIKLLDDTKALFDAQRQEETWKYWRVRTTIVSGNHKAALASLNDIEATTGFREMKTIMLHANAKRNNNWQPLIQHLETSYRETKNSIFLFECCNLKAQQKDWEYVAERAEELVKEIGTAEALRIAAISTYNKKRFQHCLELLDKHRELFGQQRLPSELRRIRVFCQRALGILSEAITEAEILAHEEPTTTHILDLAQIYYEKGDLKMLAIISRQLVGRSDLSPENSFWLARLLQWEDQKLAISFWRGTAAKTLPDTLVGEAVTLGYQLGLDREVTPLLKKLYELGHEKRGGTQIATIDDIISFTKQQYQDAIKLSEFYRGGTIPIHMIAERLQQRPLADLYHVILSENEAILQPKNQLYLLARHGGRGLISGFPDKKPEWRLNLDITALLLAAHLDILSEAEKTFKPLRIPRQIIPALVRMRDHFTPHQPSRLRSYEQIINLAERGLLLTPDYKLPASYEHTKLIDELGEDWVAIFENIRANNGYIVEYLPLTKRDRSGPPTALPENANLHLVNCRGLVEALRQHGPLSEEKYRIALDSLGTEGQIPPSEVVPQEKALLFCCGNIPEVLADANLLDVVCNRYRACMEKKELDRVYKDLKLHKQRIEMIGWLGNLIERISRGIEEGIYQIIPQHYEENEIAKKFQSPSPEIFCLLTLVQMKSEGNDVIWADDRHLNSHAAIGTAPSIGINEVLKALVSAGTLELTAYNQKLLKLRAACALFIPIQKEEVLYHLKNAGINNGIVTETQELGILRRYIASCLMHGDILQKPPIPHDVSNKNGEIAFVLSLSHVMAETLIEVWADEENDITLRARSNWLIENIYLDHLALLNVTAVPRSRQDDLFLVAISVAGLMFQAFRLIKQSKDKSRNSSVKSFFDWIYDCVLRKRLEADPQLLPKLADALKKYFQNAREKPLKEYPADVVIWIFQKLYVALPEPIRDEIRLDTDFMASMGYETLTTVGFGDLNFNANGFWKVACEAVNGNEAAISPIGSDKEIKLHPFIDKNGLRTFGFTHPETGQRFVIGDFDVELLLNSPIEREKAMRNNRQWLDCTNTIHERIIAEIVLIDDPQHRIEEARIWRDSSATFFYANLNNKLHDKFLRQEPFNNSDLLPKSAEGLLRHLRLERDVKPGAAFQETLEKSAGTLIEEDGIQTALDRLVGLPVPLPVSVISAIATLSQQERHALIKELVKVVRSPISKIHFLYILLHFGDESPAHRRLARRLMTNLLSPESATDFDAYLSILNWASEEFGYWKDTRDLSHHLRLTLVWTYSHRLYTIFKSFQAPSDWLHEIFSNAKQRIPYELFNRNPDYWFDIVHPRRVNWISFLLSGLSYSLGGKTLENIGGNNIQDRLTVLSFPPNDNIRLPHPQLMMDLTMTRNSLVSFLGGDRSEKLSSLLSADNASALSNSSLQDTVKEAVTILIEKKDFFLAWAVLNATLSDLPPNQSLVNELKTIFKQTDFVELFKANSLTGSLAILVASFQVGYIRDEILRVYLKEQLVKIARFLADSESDRMSPNTNLKDRVLKIDDIRMFLLDPALNLSLAAEQTDRVMPEFTNILTRLVDAWPAMVPIVKHSAQRLCQELPVAQAQQFLQLLIRLRAE